MAELASMKSTRSDASVPTATMTSSVRLRSTSASVIRVKTTHNASTASTGSAALTSVIKLKQNHNKIA